MARRWPDVENGVLVQGLQDMQRVLKRAESELGPELKQRLRDAGEHIVLPAVRGLVPHGTRPHRGPRLADTLKIGVTQRGASSYSTSEYGGVQNVGGRVGRHHATLLRRGDVSQYMTRGVQQTQDAVAHYVEETLDWLETQLRS